MKNRPEKGMCLRAVVALLLTAGVAVWCLLSGGAGVDPGGSGAESKPGLSMDLPDKVGVWRGTAGEVSRAEKEILPEDTEFAKMNYRRGYGIWQESVFCSVVLSGKDRTSIHRPEVCLVGQGWNIDASTEQSIELRNGENLAVRRLALSREVEEKTQRALYYYWFVGSSATTADHLDRILLTAKDNIFHNRNPRWAYVSVMTLSGSAGSGAADGQQVRESDTLLKNFIAQATPAFQTVYVRSRLLAGSAGIESDRVGKSL